MWLTTGVGDLHDAETRAQMRRWMATKRGPLTSNAAESGAFLRSRPDLPAPDVQLHVVATLAIDHGLVRPPGNGLTILPAVVDVRSRGRLTLRSADPRWRPVIDAGYYPDAANLDARLAAARAPQAIVA